ncbi:MAG: leucyl aminopeptidase [Bryobacteraceae bacterium]|nr:leucyl aminopeptidase [Solibacteraceae bacterium]MCO5352277.1 leucyl aminopeptidase [Bryobacteraceae bacterium]
MELILSTTPAAEIEAGALVVICFEDETPPFLNDEARAALTAAREEGEFDAKPLSTLLWHRPAGLKAQRLLAVGGGPRDKFDTAQMRKIAGLAVRTLKPKGMRDLAFRVEGDLAAEAMIEALAEGVILGDYEPNKHQTDPKKHDKRVENVRFSVPEESIALIEALRRGRTTGEAQNYTRILANEPANLLTPLKLVEEARTLAAEFGLECEILDEARMRQLGMGALLGVAQGSAEPPALIVLKYVPQQAPDCPDHLALVGKGVTFDTGGVSIKPSEGMEKMKYDMSGAAAVLGAMRALAQMKPRIPVTAYAPCVENMVSSRAQRPGDIVTSYLGKTIEVLNTDAEGRLILADALTYAVRQGATHLVDAATLTGAIAVALAHLRVGVFSNDKTLENRVLKASEAAGERMWPLPMDDDYNDYLKSAFADLANIGGRWGGAITAAKFLEPFVEGKPWVHLDIAGTAWLDEGKPFLAKGPSGVPVRSFVRLAMEW